MQEPWDAACNSRGKTFASIQGLGFRVENPVSESVCMLVPLGAPVIPDAQPL
jgi:hypothetical protein